jgi:hypothetical protein
MLHIVQVLLSGNAETPQVYFDEGAARAAFVDCAKKYWAQAYASFCEGRGLDSDCITSAQAFVASFDLADRSRIHYWTVTPEEGAGSLLPDPAALKERIEQLAETVEQASDVVREGLNELLATIAAQTKAVTVVAAPPAGEPDSPRCPAPAERSSSPTPEATLPPSIATDNTREWHEYVETIKNLCGGNRSEYPLLTRHDWRQAVYSGETSLEYWEWAAAMLDHYIEKAQQAGYTVVADPDKPDCYRFMTRDGVVSDIVTDAEGEAWCRAGLHLEGKG